MGYSASDKPMSVFRGGRGKDAGRDQGGGIQGENRNANMPWTYPKVWKIGRGAGNILQFMQEKREENTSVVVDWNQHIPEVVSIRVTNLFYEAEQVRDETIGRAVVAVKRAFECGSALNEAKSSLPHGLWLPWLDSLRYGPEQKPIPERTARLFMAFARKSATIADLDFGQFKTVKEAYVAVGLMPEPAAPGVSEGADSPLWIRATLRLDAGLARMKNDELQQFKEWCVAASAKADAILARLSLADRG